MMARHVQNALDAGWSIHLIPTSDGGVNVSASRFDPLLPAGSDSPRIVRRGRDVPLMLREVTQETTEYDALRHHTPTRHSW